MKHMQLKAGQFYGRPSQKLSSAGFLFTERKYSPKGRIPMHAHERAHFCFVLSGNYLESIGTRRFERRHAALVFYPEDISHAEEHFADGRHFLVEIEPVVLDRMREYGARLEQTVSMDLDSSICLASRMYQEFDAADEFAPLVLESIATELLVATTRSFSNTLEKGPPNWLKRAKEYLRQSFVEPPGLSELALAASVHPAHLARVFRQYEHCTPGEYVRRLRISKARTRLLASHAPIVEIAHELGFSDQSHFTRSFRAETGITPGEYRRLFFVR